ncbi:hypothetical protein D5086_015559 [Populus alba]|uniref:Uncharacterized protein n=1 Tax=Populus alba TaxID=43335 RepID=A0ACC4BSS4_POPAL
MQPVGHQKCFSSGPLSGSVGLYWAKPSLPRGTETTKARDVGRMAMILEEREGGRRGYKQEQRGPREKNYLWRFCGNQPWTQILDNSKVCLDGHGWTDKIVPVLEPWLRCRPPLLALTKAARRIADDFIRFGRDVKNPSAPPSGWLTPFWFNCDVLRFLCQAGVVLMFPSRSVSTGSGGYNQNSNVRTEIHHEHLWCRFPVEK